MPKGLHRYYGTGHLHFITFSLLSSATAGGGPKAESFSRNLGASARPL